MDILNQVLVQLSEADRFAAAANPHHRRLAIILLDNIVEVQLRRKADTEFLSDHTTWYDGPRKHNRQTRRSVFRHHPDLVAFAEGQGWINPSDARLLNFAHRIRNESYHEGGFDWLDGELAIRLLYSLIERRFPEWRTGRCVLLISSNPPVAIETAAADQSGNAPLVTGGDTTRDDWFEHSRNAHSAAYWNQAICDVLRYSGDSDTKQLIHDRIIAYLDEVNEAMNLIQRDSEGINLYDVIARRMTSLTPAFAHAVIDGKSTHSYNYALNVYAAVLPEEERLLDIVDPVERANACHNLFRPHEFCRKFLPKERVRKYRRQAARVIQMDPADGIDLFLEIEADLSAKRQAVSEFAIDLDGYVGHLVDVARGK